MIGLGFAKHQSLVYKDAKEENRTTTVLLFCYISLHDAIHKDAYHMTLTACVYA